MPIDREALTPQQRLAVSRRALVQHLHGEPEPPVHATDAPTAARAPGRRSVHTAGLFARSTWFPMVRSIAERWWRRHPANAVGHLARPVLDRYARNEPVKLLAASAGVGALIVLVKPWRLLSAGAVVAALMKSSDIADIVTTLMHKGDEV